MKLTDLTEKEIQAFAGSVMYGRGKDYHESGKVYDLNYDPGADTLSSMVTGNYGDYEVTITYEDDEIDADCDCP